MQQWRPDRAETRSQVAAGRAWSELSRSVDVGAVFDGHDGDLPEVVIDAVYHPVVAPASAAEPLKAELQRLADTVRVPGQRAVQEFDHCRRDFLGEPGQRPARRGGPGDRELVPAHRPEMSRRASSLLSTASS